MKLKLFDFLAIIFVLSLAVISFYIWKSNQPPVAKQGSYLASSLLKVGEESFRVNIYRGKLGHYFFQRNKGKVFEARHRFWVLTQEGELLHGYSFHNYEKAGSRYTVGLVQMVDVYKREFKDNSAPTLNKDILRLQVSDGVYGDIELSDQIVAEVMASLSRGKELEDKNK